MSKLLVPLYGVMAGAFNHLIYLLITVLGSLRPGTLSEDLL